MIPAPGNRFFKPDTSTFTRSASALLAALFMCLQPVLAAGQTIKHPDQCNETYSSIPHESGVLNGVRVCIPTSYLLNGIVHAGEPRDGLGAASNSAIANSNIDNFGILVRLSDLHPLTTSSDREAWEQALAKPEFPKTWMMVSFDVRTRFPSTQDSVPSMIPDWGPYNKDKAPLYGLEHFDSIQSVDDGTRGMYGHVEYFFNPKLGTTIMCQTHRKKVAPFDTFSMCEHHFPIPDLKVMAIAIYTKKDVPRWGDIEDTVRKIAHSFVVNNGAN